MIITKEALTSIKTKAIGTFALILSIGNVCALAVVAAIGLLVVGAAYMYFRTAATDRDISTLDDSGNVSGIVVCALVLLLLGAVELMFGLREKVTGAISIIKNDSIGELIKEEFQDVGRDPRIAHTALSAFFFLNFVAILILSKFELVNLMPALNSLYTTMIVAICVLKANQHFF